MERYNISLEDIDSNFFHFTWKKNLDSIEEQGLVPKKGRHARYIEKTKKVFFVQGLDNLLILFDCWINVYKKRPYLPDWKILYGVGSKVLRSRHFPMFLADIYFALIKNSKRHKEYAYDVFDHLLDECVLLNLDIKEGEDFSFSDIDEIKSFGYRKRHLIELGYSEKYSDMSSNKMDPWNLHTLSNKGIEVDKLKMCYIENSSSIKNIVYYVLEHTNLCLEDICPVLYDYLKERDPELLKHLNHKKGNS